MIMSAKRPPKASSPASNAPEVKPANARRDAPATVSAAEEPGCSSTLSLPSTGQSFDARLQTGATVGYYRLLKKLGQGGMGIVYLAEDVRAEDARLRRKVALKVMRPENAGNPQTRARFLREALAAAAITHEHIVTVYEVNETADGISYLAMAYLQGETLESRCRRQPLMPLGEVCRVGSEIAAALTAVHALDLVHRDVKPSNIWLEEPAGRVKLLDFGLARLREPLNQANVVKTTAIVGTAAYMSPEQARVGQVDARSDLFSLGCVLYQLATGHLPFRGANVTAMLIAVTLDDPVPPCELRPDLSPRLGELILRMLAKKPEDRPPSAAVVGRLLMQIAKAPPPAARPKPAAASRAKPAPPLPASPAKDASLPDWLKEMVKADAEETRRPANVPDWLEDVRHIDEALLADAPAAASLSDPAPAGPAAPKTSVANAFLDAHLALQDWVDDPADRALVAAGNMAAILQAPAIKQLLHRYATYGAVMQERLTRRLACLVENRRKYLKALS
jgi:serine/threonine protein kinase